MCDANKASSKRYGQKSTNLRSNVVSFFVSPLGGGGFFIGYHFVLVVLYRVTAPSTGTRASCIHAEVPHASKHPLWHPLANTGYTPRATLQELLAPELVIRKTCQAPGSTHTLLQIVTREKGNKQHFLQHQTNESIGLPAIGFCRSVFF